MKGFTAILGLLLSVSNADIGNTEFVSTSMDKMDDEEDGSIDFSSNEDVELIGKDLTDDSERGTGCIYFCVYINVYLQICP